MEGEGEPTIEQRRNAYNLPPTGHVPGYAGYCPQFKFQLGKDFTRQTADLSKSTPHVRPKDFLDVGDLPVSNVQAVVPQATGINKYHSELIPGYGGYVPNRADKVGVTYRNECNEGIADFMTSRQKQDKAERQPSDGARQPDTNSHHSNNTRNESSQVAVVQSSRRGAKEPPIPGYQGFVPRFRTTDRSLGSRFHVAASRSLQQFSEDTSKPTELDKIRAKRNYDFSAPISPSIKMDANASFSPNRLYQNSGMVPRYTGFIPQNRYAFGKSYGSQTRDLPVCSHKYGSYGRLVDATRDQN